MSLDQAAIADHAHRISFLLDAVHASAALAAAQELGVLARLEADPANPPSLARDCAIGERGARSLLTALAGLGLVEAMGDGSYHAVTPLLGVLGQLPARCSQLAEVIRDNRPTLAVDTPSGAETFYPEAVIGLADLMAAAANCAADYLPVPAGGRVLDVGAGAAPWSLALAARDPDLIVTAMDLPAVLGRTREAVATRGCERQFRYLAGDMSTVDWGSAEYDLTIVGNVCHLFDETTNKHLLERLRRALRPGGRIAVLDSLPNERLDGPRSVVLYGLSLLLRTRGGGVYPFSTYASWLREAGLEDIERVDLASTPRISLVSARRPDAMSRDVNIQEVAR